MAYVADTHALIWFFTNDPQLSTKARDVFERAERGETIIIIPTIYLMEILYVCEKKGVADKFKDILKKLKISFNYMVLDLNLEITINCADLGKVKEMHDRIIVATAKKIGAPLITADQEITNSGYIDVIW